MTYLCIAVGGGLGSALRYSLALLLQQAPYGTYVANSIACLLLGILLGYQTSYGTTSLFLLLAIGFCGGLSTFSTLIGELYHYFTSGYIVEGITYLGLSCLTGMLSLLIGTWLWR